MYIASYLLVLALVLLLLLHWRRIQVQPRNGQLERITPRIGPGNVKIQSSSMAILDIYLRHNQPIARGRRTGFARVR